MNVTGVTSTMPSMEQQYSMTGAAQAPPPVQEPQVMSQDIVNVPMELSVQTLDMANSAFEDAASQLIDSMAQMTGVGQNFDARV